MLITFFANTPDSDIAFCKLRSIFFFNSLLGKFNDVCIICASQSTIAGNNYEKNFFNRPLSGQVHTTVTFAAAYNIA